jgi:thiamine biosynthesis lipoprotein
VTGSTSFSALGSTATLVVSDLVALRDARSLLEAELEAIDRACSRFRTDSELTHVNACAGRPVRVSALFADALRVALDAAASTDGLVTPTLGSALRAAGYDRTFRLVAHETHHYVLESPDRDAWTRVRLDVERLRVAVPRGMQLDLGATAKALAADRAAAAIAQQVGVGALVSLGGDIAVAGAPPPRGWAIRIADDHAAPLDACGPVVAIGAGGVATSSTQVRRWRTDRGELHHVFDPRTGAPARTPWRTVSTTGATCVEANVAATCALVLGLGAPSWLLERNVPARLVALDGTVEALGGWPADAAA